MTLIYDRDANGHHLDYLGFLINFLLTQPAETRANYLFVVNHAAKERFDYALNDIHFYFLSEEYIRTSDAQRNILTRAAFEFEFLENLADQYGINHIVFMFLDIFQVEIGKRTRIQNSIKLSGILFIPFRGQYEDNSSWKRRLKTKLKGFRKFLQMRWLLQNKNVETIFILNDRKCVEEFNSKFGRRFKLLPDPIDTQVSTNATRQELIKKYDIPAHKKLLLIYGMLSPKKNIENILAALAHLGKDERQNLCLLFAGEVEAYYQEHLVRIIAEAELCFPEMSFIKHSYFFNPVATDEIFMVSDLILVPYINFFNSSNVIGLSAKHNKPLIASKYGVMADLVKEYKLGALTDPNSPAEIATKIKEQLCQKTYKSQAQKYLTDFSAQVFIKELLMI